MSSATYGPCCGILPPHVLSEIALRGNRSQRERALRTLDVDSSLRAARVGQSGRRLIGRRLRGVGRPVWVPRLRERLGAPEDKSRSIYDADNTRQLPGKLVRREGAGPTGDEAVDEAYDYMGDTFDFYWNEYGRDSIDNAGLPLVGTVHYGEDYDNAFWNSEQMVYGDGDGQLFNSFTSSIDVIGHELTHGVTENEAGLTYWAQSGALNESVSDVFGSLVKQYVNQETADDADWLIGAELLTDQVNGDALRNMAEPGTAYDDPVLGQDPQPGDMKHYVRTISDNGGVHINSGIPNRAFYLAATDIGGYAWEAAGLIWYKTLLSPSLTPTAQFSTFAGITVETAQLLYGNSSAEADAVSNAWRTVGVSVSSTGRMRAALRRDALRAYSAVGDFSPPRPREARRADRDAAGDRAPGRREERAERGEREKLPLAEDLTVPELKATLDKAGVDYPSNARRDDLVDLAAENDLVQTEADEEQDASRREQDTRRETGSEPDGDHEGESENGERDTDHEQDSDRPERDGIRTALFEIFTELVGEERWPSMPALGEVNRRLAERNQQNVSPSRAREYFGMWRSAR